MSNRYDIPFTHKEWTALVDKSLDERLNTLLKDYNISKEDFLAISIRLFSEYKSIYGVRRYDNKW